MILAKHRRRAGILIWGVPSVIVLTAAAAVLFGGGCSSEPADAAVSLKGWSMTRDQVKQEFDRVNGEGAFDTVKVESRTNFASTLADKEALLRISREAKPALEGRHARYTRISYEKALQREFLKYRRGLYRLEDEEVTRNIPLVSREADIRVVSIGHKDNGPKVYEAQQAGATFEEIAERFGIEQRPTMPGEKPRVDAAGRPVKWMETTVRITDRRQSPALHLQGLIRNLPEGEMSGPLETSQGVIVIKILRYRPLAEASDPGFAERTRPILENLGYMGFYQQWMDSLRQESGLKFHRQNFPPVIELMSAFWDSVNAAGLAGQPVDYPGLTVPSSRVPAEHKDTPVFDLYGKTYTVNDFIRSLDNIDLDFWPTQGDVERAKFQIESRIYRLLYQQTAERQGFPETPDFARLNKRIQEEAWLNQYYDHLATLKETEPTPEEIKAEYDKNSDLYKRPMMISFSSLTYPAGKEDRCRATLKKLRAGAPLLWFDLAPAEAATDPAINYQPPTDMIDTSRPAPFPAWQPYVEIAKTMEPGMISDVVSSPAGPALVRTQDIQPARPMTLDEATPRIATGIRERKKTEVIERELAEARKKFGVKVHPERLG